ncbi:MAG: hypothetical protein H8M99_10620 [Gloeobacteraceae cyanobacterium ES-bin-144]|nr:hypothetical protein [Verrucomicrobiales bacterium]
MRDETPCSQLNASRFYRADLMMRSFACRQTALLFDERKTRSFPPGIQRAALRKLAQVHAVTELNHLAVPPGNRPAASTRS